MSTMDVERSADHHTCLADKHCKGLTVEDGKKVPAKTAKPDSLCDPCERSVQRAVEDLPRDYVALSKAVGEKSKAIGEKIRLSSARQAPLNIVVVAAMQEIVTALDLAADVVSDVLHCDPPEGREAPRMAAAALMVSTNIRKLLDTEQVAVWEWQSGGGCDDTCDTDRCDPPDHRRLVDRSGVDFALRLRKLHRATDGIIGHLDKLLKLSIQCTGCVDYQPLYQNPETGAVLCRECTRDWTDETFGLLGRVMEQREEEAVADAALEARIIELETELEQWKTVFGKAKTDPDIADAPTSLFVKVVEEMMTK